jgi:dipeptidyl aminopeptidase/acylaminoacyl peptidase
MSLAAGTRLGPYEILSPIGAGGMGEVHRGRDTRLNRTVAVKVLPDVFAADPERLARFDREAQTLAQLNHPNIAQIYSVEEFWAEHTRLHALAMEFVDGEDLADRIRRGPIPVDEALRIARQIADALDAAHQLQIVHRDLKPTNIRVREDGTVKILDFGLAKALEPVTANAHTGVSLPTLSSPAVTRAGVILGTAAYMAPEQARGKAVDRRADIWAFGVVLYEMVTGARPFDGETISDTIASILKTEPDLARVPRELHRLLERCLQKEPRDRLRDIGDVWVLLDRPAAPPSPAGRRRALIAAGAVAAGVLAATVTALWVSLRADAPPREVVAFPIPPPDQSTLEWGFALSPDGRSLAFTARGKDGVPRLWVRAMDAVAARPVPGTEGAARGMMWSPDGRFLAFPIDRTLKKVDLVGGAPITICEVENPSLLGGGVWTPDGVILFGGFRGGAMRRVSAAGGPVSAVTVLDASRQELAHGLPTLLPDGRHFLYVNVSRSSDVMGIYVGSLDAKPEEQSRTRLLDVDRHALLTRTRRGSDYLLFLRENTLMRQQFDVDRLALAGEPEPVAEQVGSQGALGLFSVSPGVLAYRNGRNVAGAINNQLTWLDRGGQPVGRLGDPGLYESAFVSPDFAHVATTHMAIENRDIVTFDIDRGLPVRFTSGPEIESNPVWSPDGQQVAFRSTSGGQIGFHRRRTDGNDRGEELLVSPQAKVATDWHDDFLVYQATDASTKDDIWLLPLTGDRKPVEVLRTPFTEADASIAPDGRWIAYSSDETGRLEIYVRAFERTSSGDVRLGGKIPVSKDGGTAPRWRRDGKELLFSGHGRTVMSVDVTTSPALRLSLAKPLFLLPPGAFQWDLSGDATRFLTAVPVATDMDASSPITVVMNWDAALRD